MACRRGKVEQDGEESGSVRVGVEKHAQKHSIVVRRER
jgi:hypothetical protein